MIKKIVIDKNKSNKKKIIGKMLAVFLENLNLKVLPDR